MSGSRSSCLFACALLAMAACVDFPAEIEACRVPKTETRVNERGDQHEFTGHPLAAAALGDGRVLVAFSAQTWDEAMGMPVTSEVRIAMLDPATRSRVTLCSTSSRDRTLSNPGAFAYGASVAAVDLTVSSNQAVALVAWIEGRFPSSYVKMRFIDGAGCPLAATFLPYPQPAFATSIAWSAQRNAVLATLHDQETVYRAWVNGQGPADTVPIATAPSLMYGFPVAAVASDGSAAVVWAERTSGARGILLDPGGNPRAAAGMSEAAAFPIDLPLIAPLSEVYFSLSVAAADRFAVAVEQSTGDDTPAARAMAREYGLDGAQLGSAYLLDADDVQEQSSPTFHAAPGGTLVAVWNSRAAGGTVGRIFRAGGRARFNTMSCDDGRFAIGARSETLLGYPSVLVSNGRVLVFHNAQGEDDPLGSATFMWERRFAELWPGPQ